MAIEDNITKERVRQLEEAVLALSADIQSVANSLREAQSIIVQIATNQQQLAERVKSWPFVKVDIKRKKPPGVD
jgi:D-aminopeptidase